LNIEYKMSTTYTASKSLEFYNIHTCVNCNAQFKYLMKRKVKGTGSTEQEAEQKAETSLQEKFLELLLEVDMHACPTCGMVQPEMIGAKRAASTSRQLILLSIIIAILAIMVTANTFQLGTAIWVGLTAYGVIALWYLKIVFYNPNSNLRKQLQKAKQEIQKNTLTLMKPGNAIRKTYLSPKAMTKGPGMIAMVMVGISLLLCIMPELWRLTNSWQTNAHWYPEVIGTGDTSTFYFNEVVGNYWRGKATAKILKSDNPHISKDYTLKAQTPDSDWTSSIRGRRLYKFNSSSSPPPSSTIYTKITIPDEQELASKTIQISINIIYKYPVIRENIVSYTENGEINETVAVNLAHSGAGTLYSNMFWLGVVGGGLLLFGLILWTHRLAINMNGNPRETLLPEDEEARLDAIIEA